MLFFWHHKFKKEKKLELGERPHMFGRIFVSNSSWHSKGDLISLNIRGFFRSLASNKLLGIGYIRGINQLYLFKYVVDLRGHLYIT